MRQPDFEGPFARAWRYDIDTALKNAGISRENDGTVSMYVIHSPMSHPIWPWLRLIMFHLRPTPGLPEAKIYKPGATHEFILQALNPDHYPPSIEPDEFPKYFLEPANFAAQLVAKDDADAVEQIETKAIKQVCNGWLNPDTDGRQGWETVFGSEMLKR